MKHILKADPAHIQVNPNVVDEHLFKTNSHHYGTGKVSGGASTWDAVPNPEPHETQHLKPVSSNSGEHRAYHGVIGGTQSINNILGNEAKETNSGKRERTK